MFDMSPGLARPQAQRAEARDLAIGTIVLTMDGALPVEFLSPGDRIVTRAGARVLRDIHHDGACRFALRFDAPEVIYADGMEVPAAALN
ncbi:putative cupin superfamily protein [Rhodovulum iodosum]|uniref:Cupin superfamily protein n=1 Tax=Rhodovulum iodosum TaxID=68291 RepID=A0ABV3XVD2_9RHOB|nr:hypothetical protein [Rhodovulum robiginosum]RSK33517.1 hypothetical protein EJA01_09485 [Rhodovulum robiginosum]